jgi:hypothetical protein
MVAPMQTVPDKSVEMLLRGRRASLRLAILRYQFPQITTGEYDANWLIIQGHVSLDDRSWTFSDPSLTTFEVRQLADWLDSLARGDEVEPQCDFIEPNLQFERTSDKAIRVSFALESAPPWAKPDDSWSEHGFEVLIDKHLQTAAERLRSQLRVFPERGDRSPG